MDDQDTWMRRYINKHRLLFIEYMSANSVLFIQGFPRLHNSTRSTLMCSHLQQGYLSTNGDLLDRILRIDGFPALFIQFCQDNECNPELVRIIERGLAEYRRLNGHRRGSGAHQDPIVMHVMHTDGYHQLPPAPLPREGDQGDKKSETHEAVFLGLFTCDDRHQEAAESVDRVDSDIADNNVVNENANSGAIAYNGIDNNKSSFASGNSGAHLLKQLECIVGERGVEHECTVTGLEGASVNAEQGFSDADLEVPCPCLHHTNLGNEGDNHMSDESASRKTEHELQGSNASSDTENVLRNGTSTCATEDDILPSENLSLVCDPNMDRNDPVKKTSCGNKMFVTAENTRNNVNVTDDIRNDENATSDKRNNENITVDSGKNSKIGQGFDRAPESRKRASLQNSVPVRSQQGITNERQSEAVVESAESFESYYLTSSDEEEFLPAQNQSFTEIENLKETTIPPVDLEEPAERLYSQADAEFGNLQNTVPKTLEISRSSETSEANFIILSTGLSGTQCQEDIEKYKIGGSVTEKLQHRALSGVRKVPGGTKPLESLISEKSSRDDSCDFEAGNKYITTGISDHHNTAGETVQEKDTSNQELLHSFYRNDSESITSETELKQVEEIRVNKSSEIVIQQQTSEWNQIQNELVDSHPVSFTLTNSGVNETLDVVEGSDSAVLEVSSSAVPAYSVGSEGFEVNSNLSRSSELGNAESETVNASASVPSNNLHMEAYTSRSTYTHAQSQANTSSQIMTENVIIHTLSYQSGRPNHSIGLLEPNPERSENDCMEGVHSNNSSTLNRATIKSIGWFLTLMISKIHLYLPEIC